MAQATKAIPHICRVNWQKTGAENRSFANNMPLAPIFAKTARFCNHLINKDFRKANIFRDCQKAFLMKNSLENFSSKCLSDPVKVPFSSHESAFFYLTSHWDDVFTTVFRVFEHRFCFSAVFFALWNTTESWRYFVTKNNISLPLRESACRLLGNSVGISVYPGNISAHLTIYTRAFGSLTENV